MSQQHYLENQKLKYLTLTVTVLLLLAIAIIAVRFPVLEHDVWWYHLPFAGLLHNINGFQEKFDMVGLNADRYLGFPKSINWIQGLFWRLTDQIGGLALPNALSFILYIIFCCFVFKLRPDFLVPLLLSIPLVAIHTTAAYIDLASSISIAIQFLSGFFLIKAVPQRWQALIVIYLFSALIGGNAKFPSTLSSLAVGAILVGFTLHFKREKYRRLLGVFLAGLLLSSITLLHNTFTFGNPFYPITVAGLPGTERASDDNSSLTYTRVMGPLQKPTEWALSITELDWKIRGVTAAYNVLSYSGDNAMRGGKGRTGGCWGALMVINFGLVFYFLARSWSVNNLKVLRDLIICFLTLTVLTAFLPHSLKMRFYLYIPILLLTINAYALSYFQFPKASNRLVLSAWILLGFSWLTNPGIILDQWSMRPTLPGLSSYSMPLDSKILDPAIVAKIQSSIAQGSTEICLPDEGEDSVGATASAYALLYGKKGFKIIQGSPTCPPNL